MFKINLCWNYWRQFVHESRNSQLFRWRVPFPYLFQRISLSYQNLDWLTKPSVDNIMSWSFQIFLIINFVDLPFLFPTKLVAIFLSDQGLVRLLCSGRLLFQYHVIDSAPCIRLTAQTSWDSSKSVVPICWVRKFS